MLTTDKQLMLADEIHHTRFLPTFRDGITATRSRALGPDYLWIDSLCIVQAGEAHVGVCLSHSALTGSIFQNCIINIGAAQGRDADAGCFTNRNVFEMAPYTVSCREVTKIGNAEEEDDYTFEHEELASCTLAGARTIAE